MPRGIPGSKAPHGTLTRYTRRACRCEDCLEAQREWRRKRYGVPGRPLEQYIAETSHHGWKRYKKHGCRCDICRAAAAAQKRRQRANNIEKYREQWRAQKAKQRAKEHASAS